MDCLFFFSFLLTNLFLTECSAKENCLTQQVKETEKKIGQSVELDCTVSADCSDRGLHYEWFVFKEHSHHHVNLSGDPLKFCLVGGSLHIKSLNSDDSGIYHCAASWRGEPMQGRQYVGPGTTLIVRGPGRPGVRYILLWLSFVLLSIYSIAIVSLIIKKCDCNRSNCRRPVETDETTSDKKATRRRTQFRDVLEEMYSKKNLRRQKQTAVRNKVETANTDFTSPNDDIYQNV